MTGPAANRAPPVLVHPPVLVVAVLAASWLGDLVLGWQLGSGPALRTLGALLLVAGAAAGGAGLWALRRGGTNVPTYRPALALVTGGIYTRSRNPIYLGGLIGLLGLALVIRSPTLLVLWPVMALILHHGVVRREEAYLEERFGEPYRDYRWRVRRWI